jgi:hypothetical protein
MPRGSLRGSRDFEDRAAYLRLVSHLVRLRNQTRQEKWDEERQRLAPLPSLLLDPVQELRVSASRFSTIRVLRNTYSVPSRLIGHTLTARVRAEAIELYLGATRLETLPRLRGQHQQRIDYRHLIGSLPRKPGAFAYYRYRDERVDITTISPDLRCLVSHAPAARRPALSAHLAAGSYTERGRGRG